MRTLTPEKAERKWEKTGELHQGHGGEGDKGDTGRSGGMGKSPQRWL